MNLKQAELNIFATGSVPDGYYGERADCSFSLLDGKVLAVHKFGCHGVGLPDAQDSEEALWLLNNHPVARNISVSL